MVLAITGMAAAGPTTTIAAPLDAPACEQLQARMDTLRKDGTEADMAQGPAWARTNLAPDRLRRIGEYVDTEEQLNFRCGLAKQRIVLPTTVEGGEEEIPAPGQAVVDGAPGAIPLPQKAPRAPKGAAVPKARDAKAAVKPATTPPQKAPPKKAAAAKPAVDGQPAPPKQAPEKKAPAPKRPKADDAYRPARPAATGEAAAPAAKQ